MKLTNHSALRAVLLFVAVYLCSACENRQPSAPVFVKANKGDPVQSGPIGKNNPAAVPYAQIVKENGSIAPLPKRFRLGAVLKYLGNPYNQRLADGMHAKAEQLGLFIDIQAGLSESDHEGQRAVMESAISKGYDAILISPQTDINLDTAAKSARNRGILLINVDNARLSDADYFIGPDHYESGVLAARLLIDRIGPGGKVAILSGFDQDYGSEQRIRGFEAALKEARASFEIVARFYCFRDFQIALQSATQVINENPDLGGIFCNSDIMALGAAQAVKAAGKSGRIVVVGRDGIDQAFEAIRTGGMAATVDTKPYEMGYIAVEVAARILMGEKIPSVVITPQQLVTGEQASGVAAGKLKAY